MNKTKLVDGTTPLNPGVRPTMVIELRRMAEQDRRTAALHLIGMAAHMQRRCLIHAHALERWADELEMQDKLKQQPTPSAVQKVISENLHDLL